MKQFRGWAKRGAFIMTSVLFASFITMPNVLAATADYTYTWSNTTTNTAAENNTFFYSVGVSSSGQYMLGVDDNNQSGLGDIWVSSNYGASWTDESTGHAGMTQQLWQGAAVSADGSHMVVTINGGHAWTSSNYGSSWTEQTNLPTYDWSGVTSDSTGQYLAAVNYTSSVDEVYTSSNYGVTWTGQTGYQANKSYENIASSSNGQYLITGSVVGDVWVSSNYGVSWTNASTANPTMTGLYWKSFASSNSGQYMVALDNGNGGAGTIWTSSNYGVTWTERTNASTFSGSGLAAVASSATGSNLTVSTYDGGLYVSSDYGATWKSTDNENEYRSLASSSAGDYLLGGTYSSGLWVGHTTPILSDEVTNTPIVVSSPLGSTLTCSVSVKQTKTDSGYSYPLGLLKICLTNTTTYNQMSITFVTDLKPSQVVARDFNTVTDTYATVHGATISETDYNGQSALELTYNLADNGAFDTDAATGSIIDPIGLATPTATAKTPDTGFGVPSSISPITTALAVGTITSVGLGLALLRRSKKAIL